MVQFLISKVISLFFLLKQHLNIDNTRYGVLSSCVSIINTIFPIAGGFFIDAFGSAWGTLAVNAFVIIGCLLTAIAANIQSFALMVVGRVIFGIGSGLIVTMQESLLSKWFRTQHLSIAIGLQLSISRLATFLGTIAAGSIVEDTNDWVWSFWLSFIICGFSIAMNIVYALVVKRLRGAVVTKRDLMELKSKKSFNWRSVTKFPVHYWHIILIEFIFAAVWSSFQTISTDLVQVHFGTTQVLAAYTASASLVVPIIATPLLGIFMDYFGFRVFICKYSAVFAQSFVLILTISLLISTPLCYLYDFECCSARMDICQCCSWNGLLQHIAGIWPNHYDYFHWNDLAGGLYWNRAGYLQELQQHWHIDTGHHSRRSTG